MWAPALVYLVAGGVKGRTGKPGPGIFISWVVGVWLGVVMGLLGFY